MVENELALYDLVLFWSLHSVDTYTTESGELQNRTKVGSQLYFDTVVASRIDMTTETKRTPLPRAFKHK